MCSAVPTTVNNVPTEDVSREHNRDDSLLLFKKDDRVYYEDLAGDYCTVIEVIEVCPWLMYVYKVRFDDGDILATTNSGLRLTQERSA